MFVRVCLLVVCVWSTGTVMCIAESPPAPTFNGTWYTAQMGPLTFTQKGNKVFGNSPLGALEGVMSGTTLSFKYWGGSSFEKAKSESKGTGVLVLKAGGLGFHGSWNNMSLLEKESGEVDAISASGLPYGLLPSDEALGLVPDPKTYPNMTKEATQLLNDLRGKTSGEVATYLLSNSSFGQMLTNILPNDPANKPFFQTIFLSKEEGGLVGAACFAEIPNDPQFSPNDFIHTKIAGTEGYVLKDNLNAMYREVQNSMPEIKSILASGSMSSQINKLLDKVLSNYQNDTSWAGVVEASGNKGLNAQRTSMVGALAEMEAEIDQNMSECITTLEDYNRLTTYATQMITQSIRMEQTAITSIK